MTLVPSTVSRARQSLSLSLHPEMFMCMCVVLYNSVSHIERIFRISWKHLRHDVRPEIIIIIILIYNNYYIENPCH